MQEHLATNENQYQAILSPQKVEINRKQIQQTANIQIREYKKQDLLLGHIIFEKEKESHKIENSMETKCYFDKFRTLELACCIFNIIGLSISVIEYDLEYYEINPDLQQNLCTIIFASTVCEIGFTLMRYHSLLNWLKVRQQIRRNETFYSSGFLSNCIIEIIVLSIFPYPFTNGIRIYFYNSFQGAECFYHLNEILGLIMLMRIGLVCRCILIMTGWYNNSTQRVCRLYACEASYMFVIRSLMRTQPYLITFLTMGGSIFIYAYAIRVCEAPLRRNEGPSSNDLSDYRNSLWNIIITMTTVGYGDSYARTDLGRLIIFTVCIFGIFIVSIMVVTLSNSLNITSLECKAITVLERLSLKDHMVEYAANVITNLVKLKLVYKRKKVVDIKIVSNLKKNLKLFKIYQRQYKCLTDQSSLHEDIERQFSMAKLDMKEIFNREQLMLKSNASIMEALKMDEEETTNFKKQFNNNIIVEKVNEFKLSDKQSSAAGNEEK